MTAAMTGGKLLSDCHEQIRMFNMPYAHVGNGIDASILSHRSFSAGTCAGAITVGFGLMAGLPGLLKSCDLKKVVDHPVEEWVEAFVKYGDTHQREIENELAGDAVVYAFKNSYCSGDKKR
jgi:hypothetical protein